MPPPTPPPHTLENQFIGKWTESEHKYRYKPPTIMKTTKIYFLEQHGQIKNKLIKTWLHKEIHSALIAK